jgi:hypothetical protein
MFSIHKEEEKNKFIMMNNDLVWLKEKNDFLLFNKLKNQYQEQISVN